MKQNQKPNVKEEKKNFLNEQTWFTETKERKERIETAYSATDHPVL